MFCRKEGHMNVDLHRFDPPGGVFTCDIRMGCVDCGKVNPGPLHCCCYQFSKKSLEQQMAERQQPKPTPPKHLQPKPNVEPSNSYFQSWPFKPTPNTSDCSIPENSPGFQEWLRTHVSVEPTDLFLQYTIASNLKNNFSK